MAGETLAKAFPKRLEFIVPRGGEAHVNMGMVHLGFIRPFLSALKAGLAALPAGRESVRIVE